MKFIIFFNNYLLNQKLEVAHVKGEGDVYIILNALNAATATAGIEYTFEKIKK